MPIFEEEDFDKMNDPIFMKKAKEEALKKKKRLKQQKKDEIEELERAFYGEDKDES